MRKRYPLRSSSPESWVRGGQSNRIWMGLGRPGATPWRRPRPRKTSGSPRSPRTSSRRPRLVTDRVSSVANGRGGPGASRVAVSSYRKEVRTAVPTSRPTPSRGPSRDPERTGPVSGPGSPRPWELLTATEDRGVTPGKGRWRGSPFER